MSLAEDIMEELQEKQEEMQNCSHETIVRDDKDYEWHCKDCPRAFVPQESHIGDRLPEIEKQGCRAKVVVDKEWNHVRYAAEILDLIGEEYDRRYVNSGGTFSKAGKRKIYQALKKLVEERSEALDLLNKRVEEADERVEAAKLPDSAQTSQEEVGRMIAEEPGQLLYDPDCSKCNGEDWEWHTEHEDEDGGGTQ